jgi:poly(hydroxyalkanoate) depolymerase family esterase
MIRPRAAVRSQRSDKEIRIMSDIRYDGMVEATRLTREGRLAEATALIQRSLGRRPVAPEVPPRTVDGPGPIEVTFRIAGEPRVIPDASLATSGPVAGSTAEAQVEPAVVAAPESRAHRVRTGRDSDTPELVSPGALLRPGVLTKRSGGGPIRRPVARGAVAPAAGRWLEGSHTDAVGTRSYKLYVPGGYRRQALPLVVMLHGCTQDPDDFAAGTGMNFLAEAGGFLVVYPAQAASANPSRCWNWFQAADQRRDRGEPALIAGITRQVMAEYHNDPARVYVAGLSAGGAMAAIMSAAYPDLFAAVGVHSGLAPGSAHDLPSAFQAMHGQGRQAEHPGAGGVPPMILFQGDADPTVHPGNADQLVGQWTATGPSSSSPGGAAPATSMRRGRAAGGRDYTCATYHDGRGRTVVEHWTVHGAGHAWSGGSRNGSYTDPGGPDASRELVRFFREHPRVT